MEKEPISDKIKRVVQLTGATVTIYAAQGIQSTLTRADSLKRWVMDRFQPPFTE